MLPIRPEPASKRSNILRWTRRSLYFSPRWMAVRGRGDDRLPSVFRSVHSQPAKRRAPRKAENSARNTSWHTAYIIGRNNRSRVREHRAIRSVAAALEFNGRHHSPFRKIPSTYVCLDIYIYIYFISPRLSSRNLPNATNRDDNFPPIELT